MSGTDVLGACTIKVSKGELPADREEVAFKYGIHRRCENAVKARTCEVKYMSSQDGAKPARKGVEDLEVRTRCLSTYFAIFRAQSKWTS